MSLGLVWVGEGGGRRKRSSREGALWGPCEWGTFFFCRQESMQGSGGWCAT